MLQCNIKENIMKIIKKILKIAKGKGLTKCQDDSLKTFFKSEYKKNADAAYWYYKTMRDLDYYR